MSGKTIEGAYAVRRTVPPSAEIEDQIDELLTVGVGANPRESLSEQAKGDGDRRVRARAVVTGEEISSETPAAGIDREGQGVIVWSAFEQKGGGRGVYASRFGAP